MIDARAVKKRFLANSAIMATSRCASAFCSIASLPIIISYVGIEQFGAWEAVYSICMLMGALQNATIATIHWQSAAAFGRNDPSHIIRLVRILLFLTLIVAAIILPVSVLANSYLLSILQISDALNDIARFAVPGICGLIVINIAVEGIGASISGWQRIGIVTAIQSAAQIVNYASAIILLAKGWGIASVIMGLYMGSIFSGCSYLIVIKKMVGRISIVPIIPHKKELVMIAGYFWNSLASAAVGVVREQKDKLVLSLFGSITYAAYYAIAARLAGFVTLLSSFFYIPLLTSIGAMHGANNWSGIRHMHEDASGAVSISVGSMALLIGGFGHYIIYLWMGKHIPEAGWILLWIVINSTVAILITGCGTAVCKGVGRADIELKYLAVGLGLNAIITGLCVLLGKPSYTIYATVASTIISGCFFHVNFHKELLLGSSASCKSILTALITCACILLSKFVVDVSVAPSSNISIFGIAKMLCMSFAVFLLAAWLVGVVPLRKLKSIL